MELFDLPLTDRKDDRMGRVVTSKSIDIDDLVSLAVAGRTDLNAATIKSALQIISDVATKELANGASVNTGLGYLALSANGVFIGDNAQWDTSKHTLDIRYTPSAAVREAVKNTKVSVRGMAAYGTCINTLTDVTSGQVNTMLTPGGGVNLTGSRIRIEGDSPTIGISLTHQTSNEVTSVSPTAILINDPSKVSFIVPATLPEGDYKLSITTQHTGSGKHLKEPRVFEFEYILSVVR